jgi:hypothetical protein
MPLQEKGISAQTTQDDQDFKKSLTLTNTAFSSNIKNKNSGVRMGLYQRHQQKRTFVL